MNFIIAIALAVSILGGFSFLNKDKEDIKVFNEIPAIVVDLTDDEISTNEQVITKEPVLEKEVKKSGFLDTIKEFFTTPAPKKKTIKPEPEFHDSTHNWN